MKILHSCLGAGTSQYRATSVPLDPNQHLVPGRSHPSKVDLGFTDIPRLTYVMFEHFWLVRE